MENRKLLSVITVIALLLSLVCLGNSSILSSDSNQFGVCIRNCAQCKKMFGAYFEGQLCADACIKFKGKFEVKKMEANCEHPKEMTDVDVQQISDAGDETGQVKGIDVSNWQGKIDWAKVAKAGVKHVFIKMSEGGTYVDPRFAENWKEAQKSGISVNCYHYFRALTCTPEQQMENIRKNSKAVNFDPTKNNLAIDVEATGNENATSVQMADNLNALLTLIKKDSVLSKRPVMIYTSYGYWDSKVKWDKYAFGTHPLWVAHWETNNPRLPEPWKKENKSWVWWQYSSKGKIDGISGDVDLDWVKV